MRQLTLDLLLPAPKDFTDFICGENSESLFMLDQWSQKKREARFLYLWGDPHSGKSHLLRAVAARLPTALFCDIAHAQLPASIAHNAMLMVDHITALTPSQEHCLFDHYNTLREGEGQLLAVGPLPPMLLPLRQDLCTRLAWGLVYQVKPLCDAGKSIVLQRYAQRLGFTLSEETCTYLLRHSERDLLSLKAVLHRANHYSLSLRRPVSPALLRDIFQGLDQNTAQSIPP